MELRYLAEYEIESHACLEDGLEKAVLYHPKGMYEVELRDKEIILGDEYSVLTAFIIFEANSIEDAKTLSEEYIKEYVDLLTFGTNIKFKVGHLLKVVDWTKGISERECHIFNTLPGDDRPYPLISNEITKSIECLLRADISPLFRRALRWFSNGVSAEYLDDQFQYFWFVMELLSQRYKKTGKVNDPCPKCEKPLYCKICGDYPKHKPYPKQSIEYLFSLMVERDSEEIFSIFNKIRNSLMHGDDISSIEGELKIELSDYVNKLGQIAWVTIFNTFANSFDKPAKLKINLIQTNIYTHMTLTTSAHILFKSKDSNNPCFDDIPDIKISTNHLGRK